MSSTFVKSEFSTPVGDRRKSVLRPNAKKKQQQHQKQQIPRCRLYYENEDVTPLPLSPLLFEDAAERQLSTYELSETGLGRTRSDKEVNLFGQQHLSELQSQLYNQSITDTSGLLQMSHITAHFTDVSVDDYATSVYSGRSLQSYASTESQQVKYRAPTHVSLSLLETETFFILDLASVTEVKDTEEGEIVQKENDHYEYLTVGKGRNRKIITAETQTSTVLLKTRFTEARQPKKKHNYAFASNWEVYDTYQKAAAGGVEEGDTDDSLSDDSRQNEEAAAIAEEDKQVLKLLKNIRFQEALIVMERLLANNNYNIEQKRFRGLINADPYREHIEYGYKLDLLWTFANSDTKGKSVVAIDWNPKNRDILAVGYGRFFFPDQDVGMVMIWNIKNPVQPERTYHFPASVTSLQFSRTQSYALAVGLYCGRLEVIDISKRDKFVCRRNTRIELGTYEAFWQVIWYCDDDYYKGEDQIIAACQNGKILKFRRTGVIIYKAMQIMQVARAEGKLKGIETLRKCSTAGVPVARYSSALLITRHPVDSNVYFIGTNEGVVHKCSTDYFHQHLDLFLAHDGPMYVLKFSPFCNMLFLTCGDDWTARIWCEGIAEPLVELRKNMESMQCADWSPKHSTIIATISGTEIFVWDLQRKAYLPQSITENPAKCRNVVVQFTEDGRCLVVGDVEGNVHIFALEDMPFPAFFQDDLLTQALMRAMVNKPELLKQIKKMGKLSFDQSRVGKHFR